MFERPGPKSRSAPSGAPSHRWPRGSAGLREAKPQDPESTGKRLPAEEGPAHLFTGIRPMSVGESTGVRTAFCPSLLPQELIPCCLPSYSTLSTTRPLPPPLPRPLASLTSHFDGHSLLGADEVDDLLMGARGDGVPIDPDDLVPDLGHRQREQAQVEGASGGWAGSLPDAPGLLSRKGDDGLTVCPSALSQPTHPPTAGGTPGRWYFRGVFLPPCFTDGETKMVGEGHREWVAELGIESKAL